MSNSGNPFPGLIQVLGELLDNDTLVDLVAIMAEPDGTEARTLIESMRARMERQLVKEGLSEATAAKHSQHLAERIGDVWATLHRTQ